jgi:hypothetical protein
MYSLRQARLVSHWRSGPRWYLASFLRSSPTLFELWKNLAEVLLRRY